MISRILLSLAVLTTAVTAIAQTNKTQIKSDDLEASLDISDKMLRWTPKAGLSYFDVTDTSADAQQAFHGGIGIEIGRRQFTFETGLIYLQTGASTANGDLQLAYLQIPANVKWYTSGIQSGLYLKSGLAPAFLTSAHSNSTRFGRRSIDEQVSDMDVMTTIGVGGLFITESGMDVLVEATLTRGLVNISDGNGPEGYNQGLMLSTGVSL